MIYGVTITDVDEWESAVRAIDQLGVKVTPRIVLDDGRPLEDYLPAVQHFRALGDVMLEVSDSKPDAALTTAQFEAKCREVKRLWGDTEAIIEIRNEANGDWTAPDSAERMKVACDIFSGMRTAVTLFMDDTMASWWALNKVPVDYLLLSFYPTSWLDMRQDWDELIAHFAPDARVGIGIGEFGLEEWARPVTGWTRRRVIEEVCGLRSENPRFLGGYFYWDFQEWCVPANKVCFQAMKKVWFEV